MSTAEEVRFSQLLRIATRAGNEVASQYGGYVEPDDMRQEALAWLFDPAHASRVNSDEAGDLYANRLHAELLRFLIPRARAERQHATGGDPEDDKRYSLNIVKAVLPALWTGEGAIRTESEIRGSGDPSEGGNWQAAVLDVARAFRAAVGRRDAAVLFDRFVLGSSWEDVALAQDADTTADAVRMRATRALHTMVDFLNGIPTVPGWGGPGSRTARSNKHMQHLIDNAYGGS